MKINECKHVEILLVEDNPGDVRLTREALDEGRILNSLTVAKDGIEAMKILKREAEYKDSFRPDVILLDLNMPKKNGFEVLADIKSDPELKNIPVVVLTTSESDQDIIKSYSLSANAYITKPVDINQFLDVMKIAGNFWLSFVKLPKE